MKKRFNYKGWVFTLVYSEHITAIQRVYWVEAWVYMLLRQKFTVGVTEEILLRNLKEFYNVEISTNPLVIKIESKKGVK